MINGLLAFVMVISTNPMEEDYFYIGNFKSCEVGHIYVELHYPEANATRCLLQEYIMLPEDTKFKNIDMSNGYYK